MRRRGSQKRILMLATDAHGGHGGIAQYNRDVLKSLSAFSEIGEVTVLTRTPANEVGDLPPHITYERSSTRGSLAFAGAAVWHWLRGDWDLIYCAHINFMLLACLLRVLRRRPILLAVYGIDAWTPPSRKWLRRFSVRPDFVISISRLTLDRFLAWSGFDSSRTMITPNAIDLDLYGVGPKPADLLSRYRLEGRTVIMTLGRLACRERYKGFDEVLEILPRLKEQVPNVCYIIAGDGDDEDRLAAKAERLGVADRVIFTGRIPETRKADFYRLADAYVMPSQGEGFGFVILEALACGIPTIGSSRDGTYEALREGLLGIAVDPTDAAAVEAAILQALRSDKKVPEGLAYFAYPAFSERIEAAISAAASKKNS